MDSLDDIVWGMIGCLCVNGLVVCLCDEGVYFIGLCGVGW